VRLDHLLSGEIPWQMRNTLPIVSPSKKGRDNCTVLVQSMNNENKIKQSTMLLFFLLVLPVLTERMFFFDRVHNVLCDKKNDWGL
jgi:hypothetical protein